jgi:hypothetical protein
MNRFVTNFPTRRFDLAVALLFTAAFATAPAGRAQIAWDPSSLAIPGGHPRLLFTRAEDLTRARAWYPTHTVAVNAGSAAIVKGYVALMTQNATLCREAAVAVLSDPDYQLEDNFDAPGAVASDQARWIGEEVILVYDWCWASFSAAERQTMRTRWNHYVQVLNAKEWGGPGMEFNNYYTGYMRNSILWGLATWGENVVSSVDKAREFLTYGYRDRFLNGFSAAYAEIGRGGVTLEGTAYGRAQLDYVITPMITLQNMGENAFARNGFAREAPLYAAYSTPPQVTKGTPWRNCGLSYWLQFPFNDDERFSECGFSGVRQEDFGNAMKAFAHQRPTTRLGQVASEYLQMVGGSVSPWIAAYYATALPTQPLTTLPEDYVAYGTRYFFTRTDWAAPARSALLMQLGHLTRVGHNHHDAGSFQWWRGGEWVSRESTGYAHSGESVTGYKGGGRVDVWHAVAHNTALFEGRGAIDGDENGTDGPANFLALRSSTDFSWAAVDLTPAYRDRAQPNPCRYDWPYAGRAIREFVFLRELETLLVLDRLTGTDDSQRYANGEVPCWEPFPYIPGSPLRTAATVERAVAIHGMTAFQSAGAGTWRSDAGSQRLTVRSLLPAGATVTAIAERQAGSPPAPPGDGAWIGNFRLEIVASGQATLEFLTAMSAHATTVAAPTVGVADGPTSRTVTVTRGTDQAVVVWPKGAVPGPIQVTYNGHSVVAPLRVQAMLVEETGPRWVEEDPTACAPLPDGLAFYSVIPCRAFDSRDAGGLPLTAGLPASINLRTRCAAIPQTAVAVAANVTAVDAGGTGSVAVLPGNCYEPLGTSTARFKSGVTRAAHSILALAKDGSGTVEATPTIPGGAPTHLLIDVSGYFAPVPVP